MMGLGHECMLSEFPEQLLTIVNIVEVSVSSRPGPDCSSLCGPFQVSGPLAIKCLSFFKDNLN